MNSGIYRIVDDKEREYVGSAHNFKVRKTKHFSDLKNQRHHNKKLQRAYNKYGKEFFHFEVLVECEIEKLEESEKRYLLEKNPYYNFSLEVNAPMKGKRHSKETIEKLKKLHHKDRVYRLLSAEEKKYLSKLAKGRKHSEETREKISCNKMGDKNPRSKSVERLDKDSLKIIERYSYMKEVEKGGFRVSGVSKCCRGVIKTSGGFVWRYSG